MGNRLSASAKKIFGKGESETTPTKSTELDERAILDNEKQNLSNLELKVEKLSNIFESAVEIQDEDSYVECYSPERKKTYLELSSVQKQVIDLETKFEDYNDEIVSNKVNILF